jgi:hypothetical protein
VRGDSSEWFRQRFGRSSSLHGPETSDIDTL